MIAMGLMARPRVLLADEPTTALDVTVQAQVLEVLREIKEKENTAIVLISHNLGVVNQLCDRVMVMYAGRIVEEGTRERLLRQPRHPYTQGLLGSIPELKADTHADLRAIPGRPPAPGEETKGCAFAPRCPLVCDRCWEEQPALTELGPDDRVACFVATGDAGPRLPRRRGSPSEPARGRGSEGPIRARTHVADGRRRCVAEGRCRRLAGGRRRVRLGEINARARDRSGRTDRVRTDRARRS